MAKLINCKSCGAEIASNAKSCPQCGAKNSKPIFKKWWFWVIIIIVIGGIGSAAGGGSDEPKKVASSSEEQSTTTESKDSINDTISETEDNSESQFGVGDTADFDGVQVKLSSALLSKGDGQFVTPDDGNLFLCLILDIKNNSSSDINVSSLMSFEAYCDDYSVNIDIFGNQAPEVDGIGQLDGTVASGKMMNGVICYQVPADFNEFELNYSPSFWNNKKVSFVVPTDEVDKSAL